MISFIRKNLFFIMTILLIATAVGGVAMSYKKSLIKTNQQEQMKASGQYPIALLDETEFDWGEISRYEVVTQSFTLSNEGVSPLNITKIMTSCGCTTAELLINGIKQVIPSSIPAGSSGIIKVDFDPQVMKSRGEVKRAVRIEINDPDTPFLIINLKANVK